MDSRLSVSLNYPAAWNIKQLLCGFLINAHHYAIFFKGRCGSLIAHAHMIVDTKASSVRLSKVARTGGRQMSQLT